MKYINNETSSSKSNTTRHHMSTRKHFHPSLSSWCVRRYLLSRVVRRYVHRSNHAVLAGGWLEGVHNGNHRKRQGPFRERALTHLKHSISYRSECVHKVGHYDFIYFAFCSCQVRSFLLYS